MRAGAAPVTLQFGCHTDTSLRMHWETTGLSRMTAGRHPRSTERSRRRGPGGPGCEEGHGKPGSGPPEDRRWPACRGGGEGDSLRSSGLCAWDLTGLLSDGRWQVRESRSQTPTRAVSRPEDAPCRWGRNQDVCPGRHERGPLCDICVRRDQGLRPSRGTCKSLLKEHGV